MAINAHGVRVGIQFSEHGVADSFERALPFGWKPVARPVVDYMFRVIVAGRGTGRRRKRHVLLATSTTIDFNADIAVLIDRLERELSLTVGEVSPLRVFVHAGVVGWRGRAIVLPGKSFSGKSTLVAELIRLGARYYSDEYALIDAKGRVHPYARPLGLRLSDPYRAKAVDCADLGGRPGSRPLTPGIVAITSFAKGAAWAPEALTPGESVLAMLENTLSARRSPEKVLVSLSKANAGARRFRTHRGEARDAAQSILAMASDW